MYYLAAIGVAGLVTFALRALPALLLPEDTPFITRLGEYMPTGILTILVGVSLLGSAKSTGDILPAAAGCAVTVAVHLLGGRRTILSVAAGTATYMLTLAILP